jgi:L-fuculose-phosphate aldolase
MRDASLRWSIIETCRRMNALRLNQGTSGNVSVRVEGGYLITPTGFPYESLSPEHIVAMPSDRDAPSGQRAPSTEWRLHRDILAARSEVGGIIHAHPPFCTALACVGREIPAFHYMVAIAGGSNIRCAPYATFGTQALSDHVVHALAGRRACLLANHGAVMIGETLEQALALAIEVETLAAQYWRALQVGAPTLLGEDEMTLIAEKFRTYGMQH